MAQNIDIVLKVIAKQNGLKGLGEGLEDVNEGAQKAGKGLDFFDVALGNLIAGGLTTAVDLAGQAAQALIDFGRESVGLASDYRETASLLENSLGGAYGSLLSNLEDIEEATGRSDQLLQQNISSIIAMTKAQGFANDAAADFGSTIAGIGLDLESFFNSETAFEDIQGALAGSSETLQKYGIDVREATLQNIAFREGLIANRDEYTQQIRTQALLVAIQEQAADAIGDAARTSEGWANSQRALNEQFAEFQISVGETLIDVLKPYQETAAELGTQTLPELTRAINGALRSLESASGVLDFGGSGGVLGAAAQRLSVLTGAYIREVEQIIAANVDAAESTDDLQKSFEDLQAFGEFGRFTLANAFAQDELSVIVEELAKASRSAEDFEAELNKLYDTAEQSGNLSRFNIFGEVGGVDNVENYFNVVKTGVSEAGAAAEAAAADFALLNNTVGRDAQNAAARIAEIGEAFDIVLDADINFGDIQAQVGSQIDAIAEEIKSKSVELFNATDGLFDPLFEAQEELRNATFEFGGVSETSLEQLEAAEEKIRLAKDGIIESFRELTFEQLLQETGVTDQTLAIGVELGVLTNEEAEARKIASNFQAEIERLVQSGEFEVLSPQDANEVVTLLSSGFVESGQEAINLAGEIEGGLSAQLTAAGAILDEDILGKLKEIGENVETDLVSSFESAAPAVNPLKENIIDAQTEIQNLDELLRAIANGVYTVNVDVQTTGIPTQGDIINPNNFVAPVPTVPTLNNRGNIPR